MTEAAVRAESAAKLIAFGASAGAATFGIYFVGECLALTWLPRFAEPGAIIADESVRLHLALLALYVLVGVLLGGALGLALARSSSTSALAAREPYAWLMRANAFVLGVATVLHVAAPARHALGLPLALAYAALALALLGWTTFSTGVAKKLLAGANAWSVTAWLVSAPLVQHAWASRTSPVVLASGLVVLWLFVCVLGAALRWLAQRLAPRLSSPAGFLASAAVAAALGVLALLAVDPPQSGARAAKAVASGAHHPNVVLLVMDTVRTDHLSLAGYARRTSPFLSELSKTATYYPENHAAADLTLPTHASIFTGLYPEAHGARPSVAGVQQSGPRSKKLYARPLDAHYQTMAELLSDAGYRTAAVVANHGYLSPWFGLAQGFASFSSRAPVTMAPETAPMYLRSRARRVLGKVMRTRLFEQMTRKGHEINADVFETLADFAQSKQPFFLFANYMDAHDPYQPPAPYDVLFPGKIRGYTVSELRIATDEVMAQKRTYTQRERDHVLSQYDGGIAYMDHCIQDVVARLQALGMYDDTLLIVTSDHGESLGEHHMVLHGAGSAYEDQVRVPLIIKYPAQRKGEVFPGLVSQVDLLPTVLDVAGLPPRAELSGASLRSTGARGAREVLAQSAPEQLPYELHPRFRESHEAVLYGDHKLIRSSGGKRELYDLSRDPGELHDLSAEQPQLTSELTSRLGQAAFARTSSARTPRAADDHVDADAIKRLRALGYVK